MAKLFCYKITYTQYENCWLVCHGRLSSNAKKKTNLNPMNKPQKLLYSNKWIIYVTKKITRNSIFACKATKKRDNLRFK